MLKNFTKSRVTRTALLAFFFLCAQTAQAETITLNSSEMHKATEHVSFGIPFFGLTFLSFDRPNERNANNIQGFHQVTVWDNGKLVTIKVAGEDWEETRARTTHGCIKGRRLSKATFTVDVKAAAQPANSKDIKDTDVKLVSIDYYEEQKPR